MPDPQYRCGMEAVIDLLGGKWKMLILYHLRSRRLRFSELRRLAGRISEKMLSQQLKEMAADRLVQRIDFQTVPPHVEYELSQFGLDLCTTMAPMCEWGERHTNEIETIAGNRGERQRAA